MDTIRVIVLSLSVVLCLALSNNVSAQSSQIQGARDNTQVFSGVVYGPIDQNDTLWRIASRYKQDSRFTVYQVMLAIYELNPQAFENGNFNTMVNGATLQLPSDRYIARTDAQAARAKAQRDDTAFGRRNSIRDPIPNPSENSETTASNIKPDVPLVNKEELSQTQAQLQSQIQAMRRQQQQQVEDLKSQVSASITSVEILLEENKKLNQRLVQIDENNRILTQTVETELQTQLDEQDAQLKELMRLLRESEAQRKEDESQSVLAFLTSNTGIAILSSFFTFLILILFGFFLLRKNKSQAPSENLTETNKGTAADIVDDELVIGELAEDPLNKDSDDLMAALAEDDNLQADDILSDELENDDSLSGLDDDDLSSVIDSAEEAATDADDFAELDGLDDLGDIDDDMLVPDIPDKDSSDDNSGDLTEEDLDSISLDDDDFNDGKESVDDDLDASEILDGTDDTELTDPDSIDDLINEQQNSTSPDDENESGEEQENDSADPQTDDANNEELSEGSDKEDEKASEPENTPSLAASASAATGGLIAAVQAGNDQEQSDVPQGIGLDENGEISDDTLDQIGQQIEQKDQNINRLADELLNDLDIDVEEAEEPEEANDSAEAELPEETDSIDIDALIDGEVDTQVDSAGDDNADQTENLVQQDTQDSKAQSSSQDIEESNFDTESSRSEQAVTDSGEDSETADVAEISDIDEIERSADSENTVVDESDIDALLAESLDSEGLENNDNVDVDLEDDELNTELETDSQVEELADELLAELSDDETEQELDALLAEFETEDSTPDGHDESEHTAPDNANRQDSQDNEITQEETSSQGQDEQVNATLDADELLEDIPSFALDEDPEVNDKDSQNELESTEQVADEKDSATEFDMSNLGSPEGESDQDVLADLPDLDDWLDDDDTDDTDNSADAHSSETDNKDTTDKSNEDKDISSKEDELLSSLDEANFDDMLDELSHEPELDDLDSTYLNDLHAQENTQDNEKTTDEKAQAVDLDSELPDINELEMNALDLDALISEDFKQGDISNTDQDDDFLDVDELLKESDAMPAMEDDELELDLDKSLDKLVAVKSEELDESQANIDESIEDQASNLDLAQVYIDMEDFEAAKELLSEVTQLGSDEQKAEAQVLLKSI